MRRPDPGLPMPAEEPATRLDELDYQEMRQVARAHRPEMTDEQFDASWAEFVRLKQQRGVH